jgi:hypothetical protein
MPKLKQLVKRTNVEVAKARRTCKLTKSKITKGNLCLVVYDGPQDRSCYSVETAVEMINAARLRLDELEKELS